MKNPVWFITGGALFYYLYTEGDRNFVVPQHTQVQRTGNDINWVEFMALFDQKRPFSTLAADNYYTVVEVYLDSCAICKRLKKASILSSRIARMY